MNKLYFGDNLEILREMDEERVDLICTDPPFNSGRDYNSFIGDSLAQKKAFTDMWTWDTATQDARADIEHRAYTNDTYKALDECLKGYDLILRRAVQQAEKMGSFEHNERRYPRLQFWQIDDAYFENPEIINTFVQLPMEWRIRPSQKSERHFGGEQREFLR